MTGEDILQRGSQALSYLAREGATLALALQLHPYEHRFKQNRLCIATKLFSFF